MHSPSFLSLCLWCAAAVAVEVNAARVLVDPGSSAREEAIVCFTPPAEMKGLIGLKDSSGRLTSGQQHPNGQYYFIAGSLPSGSIQTYEITSGLKSDPARDAGIKAERDGTRVEFTQAGQPVFHYQAEPSDLPRANIKPEFQRGGYIHPVFTPSGRVITDDYPADHIHHHGIWFPWTKTKFEGRQPDFWNMGQKSGSVEFVSLGQTWQGPVLGGFEASHRLMDLTAPAPKAALNEKWEVTVYNLGDAGVHIFDFVSTQACAGASPLTLPKYHYGGLGFRGHWDWNGAKNTRFLTSEGETDRVKGNETRGRWCYVGGNVKGQQAGLAILCHPSNFRAPQPMRLNPTEPFFCFAPSQLGDWEITPDKPYVSRYRFVVFDGEPDRARIDRWWHDYAHPAQAKLE